MSLNINFSLLYPAKLKIVLPTGTGIFSDPKEATHFVQQLETRHLNNPRHTQPTSNSLGSDSLSQKDKREKTGKVSSAISMEPRLDLGGIQR